MKIELLWENVYTVEIMDTFLKVLNEKIWLNLKESDLMLLKMVIKPFFYLRK